LVFGFWFLVFGFWFLVFGFWFWNFFIYLLSPIFDATNFKATITILPNFVLFVHFFQLHTYESNILQVFAGETLLKMLGEIRQATIVNDFATINKEIAFHTTKSTKVGTEQTQLQILILKYPFSPFSNLFCMFSYCRALYFFLIMIDL
jgi:hypothetical protein